MTQRQAEHRIQETVERRKAQYQRQELAQLTSEEKRDSKTQGRTAVNLSPPPTSYVILTNPVSGNMRVDQKLAALKEPAEILNADIHGLDKPKRYDLPQCARALAEEYDVIVVAGGDGTFSDVINAIDTSRTPVAYLPLGSGNAMKYALGYKGSLAKIAYRIKGGEIHEFDLIGCDRGRRAVTASLGIEGTVLQVRNRLLAKGVKGFPAYLRALFAAYFSCYEAAGAELIFDGAASEVASLLTILIAKHPYYGYGMNVVPRACFDDGRLHALWIRRGLLTSLFGFMTAFTIGNRIGRYMSCEELTIKLQKPLLLQTDGNTAWMSERFHFKVLPKALKIKF
jgi:diacylglycerol kinase (ATP)